MKDVEANGQVIRMILPDSFFTFLKLCDLNLFSCFICVLAKFTEYSLVGDKWKGSKFFSLQLINKKTFWKLISLGCVALVMGITGDIINLMQDSLHQLNSNIGQYYRFFQHHEKKQEPKSVKICAPPSDNCLRLQQSLEEEDGGRNKTLKSRQPWILRDIFLRLAANQTERWRKTKQSSKQTGQRHRNQIALNKAIFIPSSSGLCLLGHIHARIITQSVVSAVWLVTYWNNPVGGVEIHHDSSFFFFKYSGLGNEARKEIRVVFEEPQLFNSRIPRSLLKAIVSPRSRSHPAKPLLMLKDAWWTMCGILWCIADGWFNRADCPCRRSISI